MFAVIRTGGKQYRVAVDEKLKIQKLAGEPGDSVTFADVLAHGGDSPVVGAPLVSGASVVAEIVEHGRDGKIVVFKKRRRQNSRRKNGHRQDYTLVRISEILTEGGSASGAKAKKPRAKKATQDEAAAEGAAAQE